MPDEFLRGLIAQDLPPPGAYGVGVCFLPQRRGRRAEFEAAARGAWSAPRASACSAGATSRSTRTTPAWPPLLRAAHQAALRRRPRPDLAERPGRLRAQALRDPAGGRAGRRARTRHPELLLPHDRLQGDAHGPPAARLLPRPAGRADEVRARARPLALLHQHVPELGARPPLPDDRPQRRDQHAARQRQLDARARVASSPPSCSATTCRRSSRSCAGRLGLGDLRQRARAAHARRPQRSRTR